jgi:hypothetical protein
VGTTSSGTRSATAPPPRGWPPSSSTRRAAIWRWWRTSSTRAAEGINITQPTLCPLYEEGDWFDATVTNAINGVDWQTAWNTYKGWKWPHRIADHRVYFSGVVPSAGTFTVGDEVHNAAPSELGSAASKYVIEAWVCTVAGSPGTWLQRRTLTGN